MNFCPECGSKLESDWKICPQCGFNLSTKETASSRIYNVVPPMQPQYYTPMQKAESNINGIVSLIFGILGLVAIPFVGSIIAMVFGNIGKKKDSNPSMANIGYILGVIGLLCSCCLVVVLLSFLSPILWYYP